MVQGLPFANQNMVVGLLGGSFDPPHAGHVHISKWALRSFGLDAVWWLVSPGNPLKTHGPAPVEKRMHAANGLIRDPRILVTDLETQIGTRYTAETLEEITARYRGTRFVWLMGADNLRGLHRWDRFDTIMHQMPVGVLARPGEQLRAGTSKAARKYARFRLNARRAAALPYRSAPSWCLLTGPMVDLSSTELRAKGDWT
ncbi:MAG: nicotinate-nucleotide adenylyltransferase [Pseudomonadota bacterium]